MVFGFFDETEEEKKKREAEEALKNNVQPKQEIRIKETVAIPKSEAIHVEPKKKKDDDEEEKKPSFMKKLMGRK